MRFWLRPIGFMRSFHRAGSRRGVDSRRCSLYFKACLRVVVGRFRHSVASLVSRTDSTGHYADTELAKTISGTMARAVANGIRRSASDGTSSSVASLRTNAVPVSTAATCGCARPDPDALASLPRVREGLTIIAFPRLITRDLDMDARRHGQSQWNGPLLRAHRRTLRGQTRIAALKPREISSSRWGGCIFIPAPSRKLWRQTHP